MKCNICRLRIRGLILHFILFLGILTPRGAALGQTYLGGNIFSRTNDSPLTNASIINLTNGLSTRATLTGTYLIEAKEGDLIVFSFTGMTTDTVKVESQILREGHDVGLKEHNHTIKTVTIISSYQLDSLRRREENMANFERGPGITGRNHPSDGFGISISPVSHFSKKAREQRRLRKQLIKNEKEAYIDYMFSPGWISRLTGLKADSLQQFMNRYRPSYKMVRALDRPSLIVYISDKYKEFIHKP